VKKSDPSSGTAGTRQREAPALGSLTALNPAIATGPRFL